MKQIGSLAILAVVILLGLYIFAGVTVIQDGQVGVRRTLGKISDKSVDAGVRWVAPIFSQIEVWDIKTQEQSERAEVPSSEGLISTLDVSVLFNVEDAPLIRKKIGPEYKNKVLIPYIRDSVRNVASGYQVKALYSEAGRTEISYKILASLQKDLKPRGIDVQKVLLRSVILPKTFLASIESKLRAEQESLQKQFELEKATKDAEIEVARARGVSDANKIIADSISEEYIRYLWVQGLNDGNSEVIYVPTEANLPILEATRRAGK